MNATIDKDAKDGSVSTAISCGCPQCCNGICCGLQIETRRKADHAKRLCKDMALFFEEQKITVDASVKKILAEIRHAQFMATSEQDMKDHVSRLAMLLASYVGSEAVSSATCFSKWQKLPTDANQAVKDLVLLLNLIKNTAGSTLNTFQPDENLLVLVQKVEGGFYQAEIRTPADLLAFCTYVVSGGSSRDICWSKEDITPEVGQFIVAWDSHGPSATTWWRRYTLQVPVDRDNWPGQI